MASEGGCRICQTSPPAITAAAARLFPQACSSFGKTGNDRHISSPASASVAHVPARAAARCQSARYGSMGYRNMAVCAAEPSATCGGAERMLRDVSANAPSA